jgi:transposase
MRALLLQAVYSNRSERKLVSGSTTPLLFRWFVGFDKDDAVWDCDDRHQEPRPAVGR